MHTCAVVVPIYRPLTEPAEILSLEHTLETPVAGEMLHQYPARHALLAGFAIGAIDMAAAAPETDFRQAAVM